MSAPGRFPAYPNGWFRVAFSADLQPGEVKPIRYFGRQMVLFRTEAGEARVFDAFCPHLGAHLGHGGKVVGDCIQCPFHAWKFGPDGECKEIPYAEKIPPRARVQAYETREHSGMIMVWYDAEGRAPDWEVPEFEEYSDEAYTEYRSFHYDINVHIQDVIENSCDNRHLCTVHGLVEAEPELIDGEGLPFKVRIHSKIPMKGNAGIVDGKIDISNYGIGISPARVKAGPVQYLFLATVTPVDDTQVDAQFHIAMKKWKDEKMTEMVFGRILEDEAEQVARDLPIWNNKVFVDPPLLSQNDSAIAPLRKWSRQFYSQPAAAE